MVTRDHDNRSEKQKGHEPVHEGAAGGPHGGHQGNEDPRNLSGTDDRNDGKGRQNGGGDGAGGAPRTQGQGQANKHSDSKGENRGHGGRQ